MYPHPLLPGKGVLRCSKELPLAIKEACRLRQSIIAASCRLLRPACCCGKPACAYLLRRQSLGQV